MMDPEHTPVTHTSVKDEAQLSTEKQSQPEVSHQKSPSQTVNTDPVTPDLVIQDPDIQEQPTQPPPPTTSVTTTAPIPRRSTRPTAGKTTKYDGI